jgi:hypothetical protein
MQGDMLPRISMKLLADLRNAGGKQGYSGKQVSFRKDKNDWQGWRQRCKKLAITEVCTPS